MFSWCLHFLGSAIKHWISVIMETMYCYTALEIVEQLKSNEITQKLYKTSAKVNSYAALFPSIKARNFVVSNKFCLHLYRINNIYSYFHKNYNLIYLLFFKACSTRRSHSWACTEAALLLQFWNHETALYHWRDTRNGLWKNKTSKSIGI